MPYNETLHLGTTQYATELLEKGLAQREGGIVRNCETGRIIAFLQDVDGPLVESAQPIAVPLAVLGISMTAVGKRLQAIEQELQQLRAQVEDLAASTELANIKLDGMLLGKLIGDLYACDLDLAAGNRSRCSEYRQVFIQAYYQCKFVATQALESPEVLRRSGPVVHQYLQAMFLAGVAARDLSYRMNDKPGALKVANTLTEDARGIADKTRSKILARSALFWRNRQHLQLVQAADESSARLKSHQESLRELPSTELDKLIARQLRA